MVRLIPPCKINPPRGFRRRGAAGTSPAGRLARSAERWSAIVAVAITITAIPTCPAAEDAHPWRDRAEQSIDRAVFYKPDPACASADVIGMSPLIVMARTSPSDGRSQRPPRLTSVRVANAKLVPGDDPPSVFVVTRDVDIRGVIVRQWTFVWWTLPGDGGDPVLTVLRMTLDPRNRPMTWEAVDPRRATVGVFIARSLEQAAASTSGQGPRTRAPALQRGQPDPPIELARVLADGPVPMGPMVYGDDRGAVYSVACRCMPSQVRHITGNVYYHLRQLDDLGEIDDRLALSGDVSFQHRFAQWRQPGWLDGALRFPEVLDVDPQ